MPIDLPPSHPSDISIANHTFSGTSPMSIDGPSMNSRPRKYVAPHQAREFFNQQGPVTISFQRVTIESFPDNVLLDIFDFCELFGYPYHWWLRLVHVCQRWRYLVSASPHRLGMKFRCKTTTPVREILDVWPRIPIILSYSNPTDLGRDNIIVALKHRDRVCEIDLSDLQSSLLERLATMMQEPFPVLTYLRLSNYDRTPPVLPDTFLGGSAPRLRSLDWHGIPFLALPRLLLYATDLVELTLWEIPNAGYVAPDEMATSLSALIRLERLMIRFKSPPSRPDQRIRRPPPPPHARAVLPALTELDFQGISEYSEDLLARIDTPVISNTITTFFNQVDFHVSQLLQFAWRARTFEPFKRAQPFFSDHFARIKFHQSNLPPAGKLILEDAFLSIFVLCDTLDWQLSFFVQICGQFSPLLSNVERLDIEYEAILDVQPLVWQDDVDHTQWLELFRPFIAVQSLHIMGDLATLLLPALQELTGDRVVEVLPALYSLSLAGGTTRPVRQALDQFITASQLPGQPVTVHGWEAPRYNGPLTQSDTWPKMG